MIQRPDGYASRHPQTAVFLSPVLGEAFWCCVIPADVASGNGRAPLGFVRHHPRYWRCLREPSSFGMALVGRLLEAQGFRVGIISQPDWLSAKAFKVLGKPNLFLA